jgi:VCBS repeat protein
MITNNKLVAVFITTQSSPSSGGHASKECNVESASLCGNLYIEGHLGRCSVDLAFDGFDVKIVSLCHGFCHFASDCTPESKNATGMLHKFLWRLSNNLDISFLLFILLQNWHALEGDSMAGHRGHFVVLFFASCGICGCAKQISPPIGGPINQVPVAPAPGTPINPIPPSSATLGTLDFLGGIYSQPFAIAVGHIYSNHSVQPLGTKNDGFGTLTPLIPSGLESLISPLGPRGEHVGRGNRDTRIADFENDGFPDVVSNTYDCVDPLNQDDIAKLFKNNGDGTFTEVLNPFRDSKGNPITLRGRGETIVVADFNNDGFLDIFIPYYTYKSADPDPDGPPGAICGNSPQSYLLINDGTGHFTDVADAAGVSLRNLPVPVEGAQAIDFFNRGLIDLYGSRHLFINTGITNGIPHFVDAAAPLGLPLSVNADEGAKFIDAYNDGFLDLVLLDADLGPALFRFDGSRFVEQPGAFPTETYSGAFGMNAYDINNDGLDDIVIVGGYSCDPKIFLNTGSGFERVSPLHRFLTLENSGDPLAKLCDGNGAVGFGDINHDGKIDIFYSTNSASISAFVNNTVSHNPTFLIDALGPHGEHNQQGRVVRMSPQSRPDVIFTRVVDSGSGYLSQNQYSLLIASPFSEQHVVRLSLPQNFNSNKLANISFTISPGQRARVFAPSVANPNGRVELGPMRPFTFDPALYPAAQGILE